MQSGTEILISWMLIKCSLKALGIPTGLLICWPFTSVYKRKIGWSRLGWSNLLKYFPQFLQIVHVFHDFIMCCLSICNFFTTRLCKFLYIDLARIFDFARDLNWSLGCIRCMTSLFIQGDRCLHFTLFLTMGNTAASHLPIVTFSMIKLIIIHWAHYLFSDWLKFEFSACDVITVDYTIIMSRTLKVTGNRVMYNRSAWFLMVITSSSRTLCCLPLVEKQKHDFIFFLFNVHV